MSHSIDLIVYNMCYLTFQGSSLENYTSNDTIQHDKTRDNTRQHKYKKTQHKTTRDNTRQQKCNTRQHKYDTGQHEYKTT